MTERTCIELIKLCGQRGAVVAEQVKGLVELDTRATVDLSSLLNSVLVFVQGYGTAMMTGFAWVQKQAEFASYSLVTREALVEQIILWRSLVSTAGTMAFERRLTNFSSLVERLPSEQFVTERGLTLGNLLQSVLLQGSESGIAFEKFWNTTADTSPALSRLAALDLVLATPSSDPVEDLRTLLNSGVPLVPDVTRLLAGIQAPATATTKRLPRAISTTISQGESLESVAARTLGSAAKWPILAEYNDLRWPYIADAPENFPGELLGTRTLSASTVVGQKTVALTNVADLVSGQRLKISRNGIEHTLTIDAIQSTAKTVTTRETLLYVFTTQATVQVYAAAYETDGRVLRAGDAILIPSYALSGSALLSVDKNLAPATRLYGVDIALTNGQLSLKNGDIALVEGRENLRQALKRRFQVERRSLIFHPEYGTGILQWVGQKNTPYFGFLAQVDAHQTLADDPRVASVSHFSGELRGDALTLRLGIITTANEQFPPFDIRVPLA